jgi:hypothetical protein
MSITTSQEAVMGQAIPKQHPAVVLRSHYRQVRTMLAIAMVAVVGLSVALVTVASDDGPATGRSQATLLSEQGRSDGGPEESHVAAAVGSRPETAVSRPDEAKIAATVGRTDERPLGGPDESKTAAAISGD